MSFQERRAIVSLIGSILITVLYSVYMLQRYPEGDTYSPAVFHFWGSFFLILIPVTIVAKIVIYILFSIANAIATREEEPPITCLLYTSPSPRDRTRSRMPSSA